MTKDTGIVARRTPEEADAIIKGANVANELRLRADVNLAHAAQLVEQAAKDSLVASRLEQAF